MPLVFIGSVLYSSHLFPHMSYVCFRDTTHQMNSIDMNTSMSVTFTCKLHIGLPGRYWCHMGYCCTRSPRGDAVRKKRSSSPLCKEKQILYNTFVNCYYMIGHHVNKYVNWFSAKQW